MCLVLRIGLIYGLFFHRKQPFDILPILPLHQLGFSRHCSGARPFETCLPREIGDATYTLTLIFFRTLQTLIINRNYVSIVENEIEGLIPQLVALLNVKLSPTNGAFASLREICLAYPRITPPSSPWQGIEPNRFNVWLGDLRRVCEEAEVRIHADERTPWIECSSGDRVPCSLCRPRELDRPDSAPVILREEE